MKIDFDKLGLQPKSWYNITGGIAMTLQLPSDLAGRMQAYVGEGGYPSTEAVIRHALDVLDIYREDVAAIGQGIDDEAAGRVRPARDVLRDLRRRHLPAKQE